MAESVFLGIVALVALLGFALAVAWVRRSPQVGLALLGLILISLWERPHPPPIVQLSGLSFYPNDVITVMLLVVGLLELTQLRTNLGIWTVPWMLFGLAMAGSLLRGAATYGLGAAINAGRPLVYVFFAMTWALAVRPDRLRLHTVSVVFGWALVLVALYHGVRYGIGNASSFTPIGDGIQQTGRVLVGQQAAVLLLCAAVALLGRSDSGKAHSHFSTVSSLVFGGVVVLAQHRSVWTAGAVGMAAVLIWSGRGRARKQVFVLFTLLAWIAFVGWSLGILDGSETVESASDLTTYDWRTSGWRIMIAQAIAGGPLTVVAGDPFGGGVFLRQLSAGGWTSVSAHNWYVEVVLQLGIFGLMTLVSMLIAALVKSRGGSPVWTFVLAAVAAYAWSYSVDFCLAPWLGVAMVRSLGGNRITSAGSESVATPMSVGVQSAGTRR